VDPARLRAQFPALTDEDLEAYVRVTRRVLADPASKGRLMRGVMEAARSAGEKAAAGAALSAEESLALRYVEAVGKMQRPLAPPGSRDTK
jgi:hypothetical protein